MNWYTHDCDKCISLWSCHKYDLYYCWKSIPTIIARYWNEWSEYISWIAFKDIYPLNRAYKKAVKSNLISNNL